MGWAPLTGQALASIEDPAVIMSAGFSQISDAIRAGRLRESLSFLGGIRKIGC